MLKNSALGSDFSRIWSASLITNLADGVLKLAAPLLAVSLTEDPVLIGLLSAITFAMALLCNSYWRLCRPYRSATSSNIWKFSSVAHRSRIGFFNRRRMDQYLDSTFGSIFHRNLRSIGGHDFTISPSSNTRPN